MSLARCCWCNRRSPGHHLAAAVPPGHVCRVCFLGPEYDRRRAAGQVRPPGTSDTSPPLPSAPGPAATGEAAPEVRDDP